MNIYWAEDTELKLFGDLSDEEIQDKYDNHLENAKDQGLEPIPFDIFKKKYQTKDSKDRELLNLEKQILLHPRNAHHLVMPLTDEIFVKDIYAQMVKEGLITPPEPSYLASYLPTTNVKNAVIFVQGKFAVGIGALGITNKATSQSDSVNINTVYKNQQGEVRSLKLLFKGLEDNYYLSDYTDNLGTIISETQSQLLTQFVDNVKNPTAVLMGITMQTANVMDYLVRRGVNPQSIIYLINQPLVKLYLAYQKSNESYFNKANNLELSKSELIKELLKNSKYEVETLPETELDFSLVDSEMKDNLLNPKYNEQQLQMLSYFLDLQDQSRAFSDLNASQNSDTKPLKDKQALDEAADIIGRVITSDIVSKEMLSKMFTQGLVAPFYQFGRKMYKIYNPFYALSQSHFGTMLSDFKNKAAKLEKGAGKDRVRQTIENDFVLFLVQNFSMTNEFDRLMVGNNSVARRIQDLKTKLPSNLVLKQFVPMLNNVIDPETGNKVDNIRLFEKELTGFDSQDLAESLKEIAETDVELYKDLVKVLMYQSGLNISPFNYRQIITIGLDTLRDKLSDYEFFYQDLVGNGVKNGLVGLTEPKAKKLFEQFITLFGANNPQFLKKNFFHSENPYSLKKVWVPSDKKFILRDRKEKPHPQLGTGSTKKYHLGSTTKNAVPPEATKKQPIQTQGDTFVPKNKEQAEAIKQILDFVQNGNSKEWFILEGKAGTGKTTLIQEVIKQLPDKKTVYISALSHKATQVLSGKLKQAGLNAPAYTIASLLAINLNLDNGKFERNPYAITVPVQEPNVIIVDEASMINEKILAEIMQQKRSSTKVIFLGDIGQLPPIREDEKNDKPSPAFNTNNKYKLLERVRQGEESPILPFADYYWDNSQIVNPVINPANQDSRKNQSGGGTNLIFETNIYDVVDEVKDLFITAKDTKDPNLVKIVVYKNDKRRFLNAKVRELIFNSPKEFEKGEIIIFNNNYETSNKVISNSEEFSVVGVESESFKVNGKTFTGHLLQVIRNKDIIEFPVISRADLPKFNEFVAELFSNAKAKKGTDDYKRLLKEAWSTKNFFADIDYGYAITSHKAQGSTYNTVIVDEADILSVGPASNKAKSQSIYTAITRASKNAIVVNSNNPKQEFNLQSLSNVGDYVDYEDVTDQTETINIYSTDKNGYERLSNLADRKFKDKDGREYFSVEHAYQSWKSGSFDEVTYKKYSKGGVKIAGNKGTKTDNNWNINLMKRLIKQSLEQNPDVMKLLSSTGNAQLTHTQDSGIWKTEFPKLLMELRNEMAPQEQLALPSGTVEQPVASDNTITYTPIGKTQQVYTIEGNRILNRDGKEVFKEDSKDRNKIFANFAIKQKKAVVVEHKGSKYVVNQKDQIVSVTTGDIMKWTEENGNRKAILELAKEKFNIKQEPKVENVVRAETIRTLTKYELFPGVFANQGQTEALDLIGDFLNSNKEAFTLIGRGGTGKTTIIKKIVEEQRKKGKKVLGITYSHKAKKVLGRSIGKDSVKTVHSALAIKLNEQTGEFTPDVFAREQGRIPIRFADIVIVDESSMIDTKMYEEILTLKKRGTKVIFMGDNAQLPPVTETKDSPTFSVKNQYTLLEKMRQAKTSPIINTGTVVAENIESNSPQLTAIKDRISKYDEISKSGVVFIKDEDLALNAFVEDFRRSGGMDPDYVKAITFNNELHNSPQSVKNLNDKIRLKLWGEASKEQFVEGELVTAYSTYSRDSGGDENEIPAHNSDDFIVTDVEYRNSQQGFVTAYSNKDGTRKFNYKYDIVILSLLNSDGKPIIGYSVPVIANSSKLQYEQDVAKLWKTDKGLAFALTNEFANIKYGYVITSHKAQGSTYRSTYVFEDNILGPTNGGDIITKNKSLYVAVSRPTTKLVMISDKNTNPIEDINFDNSTSRYAPSLLMYQDFIKKNQLYTGEEVLPFIGESEYYRYLVPMLLKMNPDVKTMFTHDLKYQTGQLASEVGLATKDFIDKLNSYVIDGSVPGMSVKSLNTNLIRPDASTKTLVHELVHRTVQQEYDKKGQFYNSINDLYEIADKHAFDNSLEDYGFSSPTEFLAEALSNPEFMQKLNEIPYKEETVFSYLMRLVSDFINELLGTELNSGSVLAEVINLSEQVLQKNVGEISKNSSVGNGVKDGVSFVFEQNPQLNSIGTKKQYSQYLNSVFPNSKIKDIVYHGTNNQDKQEFKKERSGYLDKGFLGKGFYSTYHINYTKAFGSKTYGVLLNIQNPLLQTTEKIEEFLSKAQKARELGYDAVFHNFSYDENLTIREAEKTSMVEYNLPINQSLEQVVFESEQVYILGSNQDIESFRQWVSKYPAKEGSLQQEIIANFESYFPDYGWMNDAQKYQTAKLVEEGKLTLNCKF